MHMFTERTIHTKTRYAATKGGTETLKYMFVSMFRSSFVKEEMSVTTQIVGQAKQEQTYSFIAEKLASGLADANHRDEVRMVQILVNGRHASVRFSLMR